MLYFSRKHGRKVFQLIRVVWQVRLVTNNNSLGLWAPLAIDECKCNFTLKALIDACLNLGNGFFMGGFLLHVALLFGFSVFYELFFFFIANLAYFIYLTKIVHYLIF